MLRVTGVIEAIGVKRTKSEQRETTRFCLNCSFRGAESADFVRHCGA